MHSYRECLVSLCWCWEISQAMHCPWQHLKPGKVMTPHEVEDMDPILAGYAARNRLERVAAFRQLQGYCNQLRVMTSRPGSLDPPPMTLAKLKLPDSFHVMPVKANESRKTVRGAHEDVSFIVDKETGVGTPILPTEPILVPLLTLQLDQGAIGCAGAAFCMFFLGLMMMAKFDKIHRLIRDIKAAENCCKKIWVKTKLWSAYLWSINKRPFGKGANATQKERWMELFEATHSISSPVFLKYLSKIGMAWNMPYGTPEERQAIFNRVLELPSFKKHMAHPKLANWFAWNKCAHEQIPEFHAGKCVYESQLTHDTDPDDCGGFEIGSGVDPRSELQVILRNGGGLRLGYRLMKESLYEHVCIMSTAEHACWSYYAGEIENVKSPADNLRRTWELSQGWAREPHIWATLHETLLEFDKLNFMQIPMGASDKATKALHLSWSLASNLVWTMSKHSAPPDCYANLVRPGDDDANQAVGVMMATHHQNILSLEAAVHNVADAKAVWEACLFLNMKPVRLLLEYFRRDKYKASSVLGRHLLLGLIALLADNKIAEDVHHGLRLASTGNANDKLSSQTIQDIINHSKVIELRGINHDASVSKDFSLQPSRLSCNLINMHSPPEEINSNHSLPNIYAIIYRQVSGWT